MRTLLAKLPKVEHDRIRFNYWSALTDATSMKDGKLRLQVLIGELERRGKLRLQVLIGELERRGYGAAARCLAEDLDALVVHQPNQPYPQPRRSTPTRPKPF